MGSYLIWDKKTIKDFQEQQVADLYNQGYVFTREHKGSVYQTRSIRVNLEKFRPNSENRRVLNKTKGLTLGKIALPLPLSRYDWKIHKLGKNFYSEKFGHWVFSAGKIKELITSDKSNFNCLYKYEVNDGLVGYAIVFENFEIIHYAYPFYNLTKYPNNFGMAMMLQAIISAKDSHKKYCYLGSASKPEDKYKLQFEGLEWFDKSNWNGNIDQLKIIIS